MRLFVTGASGFVGSAVTEELVRNGHEVLGLARSEKSAEKIEALGARAHRGDLTDLSSLRTGIEPCDGVIHTGMNHDFSNWKQSCERDQQAIESMSSILVGSNKPLIITSALGILPSGTEADENSRPCPTSPNPRVLTEIAAVKAMAKGVNVSVVRLPPSTHGRGDWGFVTMLIKIAKDRGCSVYANDVNNTWPAVHRLDAAKLYRFAVEQARANSYYHAVSEEGVPFKDIAETIATQLGVELIGKSSIEAGAHFGWFAHFAAMNIRAKSEITRKALNWNPTHPGLIDDIKQNYF